MDSMLNNFTADQLHVAQQSRREKLRVQLCSPSRSGHRVDDYTSSLEVVHPSFNPADLVQVGDDTRSNIFYHPAGGSSEMLNFNGTVCNNSRNGAMEVKASDAVNSVDLASSNLDGSLKRRVENSLENCKVWHSVRGNYNEDNWNTDLGGRYKKKSSLGIVSDISASEMRAKHNTTRYRESEFQYGDMNFATQLHNQNALSDGVTTAVIGLQPNCDVSRSTGTSWGSYGGGNEHVFNVPYGYQPDVSWNTDLSSLHSRTNHLVVDSQSQGLSLSLCSYPAGSMITESQFGNSRTAQSITLHDVASIAFQDSKPCNPNDVRMVGLGQGNSLQESLGVPSTNYHRQTGPLGPFTGYATILKSSKFLRPAQQLLDEYCGVIGKFASSSTSADPEIDIGFDDLATAVNSIFNDALATGDFKGVSSATKQDSDELMKGAKDSPRESLRPDYQAKKAKLLYMLEELSRRYKQYYQQMQMVVSAFESVAGLADATPYISSALKTVSKHFNHLKNAISNQLRHILSFLGKGSTVPHSGIRDEGNFNSKRLKCTDDSYQKYKSGGSNMGPPEPQQHIWRPQRGLPERAVSVLRAWLFEHFLHPYPTDTDKHMLATRTGLTRSQVSNWFINARVRLWKPMVEEVHMLETKGVAERNRNAAEDENISANGVEAHLKHDHSSNKMTGSSVASVNLEYPATSAMYEMGDVFISNQHEQEKLSQVGSKMSSIDEGMLGISRYHQNGIEISGIGPVSLTLGLRQSADQLYRLEGSQHNPYIQQQDCMRHLGDSSTHEYAG